MSGRVSVRHKLRFPVQVDRDTLDALPSAWHVSMYVTLLRLAQAENNTAPGFKELAKQAHMSVGKASAVLNDLEHAGIIARTRTRLPNGMDHRTNYEILGVQEMNTEAIQEMNTRGVQDVNTGHLQGSSPHEHHVVVALEEKRQQQAVTRLASAGVTQLVAQALVADNLDEVERQLDALSFRPKVRDKAATLVKSIREAWSVPVANEAEQMPLVPRCSRCDGAAATTTYDDKPMCSECAELAELDANYTGPCRTCSGTGRVELGAGRTRPCPVGCKAPEASMA